MIIGVLKEQAPETRVSMVPEVAKALEKMSVKVWIEYGAGSSAFFNDEDYVAAGAALKSREDILSQSDLILCIQSKNLPENLSSGKTILGIYQPLFNSRLMQTWAGMGLNVFSLDTIPRTTRAQAMDVLSSQANIAGYKAVLLAATKYCRYFPMFMTAAGSIPPAKVMVLGAGVA